MTSGILEQSTRALGWVVRFLRSGWLSGIVPGNIAELIRID